MVRLYSTSTGNQIVKDEIKALGPGGVELISAAKRRSRGEQFSREDEQVRGRIRAIRSTYDGDEYRLLYALVGKHDQVILGLHACGKKSKKLPQKTIKLAEKRLKDWEGNGL